MPDVRMPNGTIIKNVPAGITQDELLSRLEASGYKRDELLKAPQAPPAAAAPRPVAAPTAPQEKDEGFYPFEVAKGLARGIGSTIAGVGGKFLEEAPQIAAQAADLFTPEGMSNLSMDTANYLVGKLTGEAPPPGPRATPSPAALVLRTVATELEPEYKEFVAPAAGALRGVGESIEEALPRKYSTFQEAEGFWNSLGALGVTLSEGAVPTLAGATIGYITKNPTLASGIIAASTFPQTYSGIRDTQEQTGIDDIRRAVVTSSIVTALDTLLGTAEKVRDVATVTALKEFLEAGLSNAAKEVAKTSGKEAGTEAVQNIIEQVGGGLDPTTKESLQQTLEAGLVGMLGGATFTGAVEGVQALARRKIRKTLEETDTTNDFAQLPGVEDEYVRLLEGEVTAAMEANPDLTQRQAFDQVKKNAEPLYRTAIENVIMATGGADESAGVGAGLDVSGGLEPSVPDVGELGGAPRDTGAVGEAVTGRMGEPDLGVPVSDVGQAEQPGALATEQVAPTPSFDTTPIYEAEALKDRKFAAVQTVREVTDAIPELQGLRATQYNQAANLMAQMAARGEQFDPIDVMYKVAEVERPAPTAEAVTPDKIAPGAIYDALNGENALSQEELLDQLDFLQTLAESGKLTPERLAASDFGKSQPTNTIMALNQAVKNDPVGTVRSLRERAEATAPTVEKITPDVPVFHGTNAAFNDFDFDQRRGGITFTTDPQLADYYASDRATKLGGEGRVVESRLNIQNPLYVEETNDYTDAVEYAKANGYDAVIGPAHGGPNPPLNVTVWDQNTIVPKVATPETAAPTPTPQDVLANLDEMAVFEAQDREYDVDAFLEGVNDIRSGQQPIPFLDALRLYGSSGKFRIDDPNADKALARTSGAEWAQQRIAEAQSAAPTPTAAPTPAAPTPTAAPSGFTITPTKTRTVVNINGQETVIEGTSSKGKEPKVVSKGKEVKLTEAQRREAVNKAEAKVRKLNRIQKRIAATNKVDEILAAQVSLAKLARGDKENIALLKGTLDTLNAAKWRAILPTLSTEDIFRILKGRIPSLEEADQIVRQDITRFVSTENMKLAEELEQIATFLKKFPKAAQALSDLEFASVAFQVDPTKAKTAEEYADKFDKKTKELRKELAEEKDAAKRGGINTKIKNRLDEIKSVYEGVSTEDGRVYGFNDLGRPELGANRGKEIFKLIRDGHRRDLEASYQALRSYLMETKKGDTLAAALKKLEKQFKPALDQVIYFPAMRFGPFYARVGTGENSIFKMFETENKRNQFVRLMQARGEEISETGNTEDLRNDFQQKAGGPLKEVLDLFEDNPKDMGAIKNQVFDLWLQSMSAGDMRKHMAPRKMRAGYSTDILKNYSNFRRSSINNTKRAKFGYKLQNAIDAAKASVEKQPDEPKLQAFIEEIRLRALNDLTPASNDDTVWKQMVNLGNKAAFYQYLANPKTALIQLTQLHIVALPLLAQKYGSAQATMALSKYGFSSLGGMVVSPLKAVKRGEEGGGFMGYTFNWEQPNLLDNPITTLKAETDPDLYEVLFDGWQEGRDLNLYMDTFANEIGGFAMRDPQQRSALQELMRGRVDTAALRGATFTFEAMGSLMHQMERVNREATYMAALELGYRKARDAGKPHEVAKQEAIESALETTLAATFDFSAYNKPRILTGTAGRLAGQFFTYPYMMSSLLVRNLYTAIKFGPLEPGERKAAAQIAVGALLNIFAYAGSTGLPLYGLAKLIGSMLAWAFDDDDEEGGLTYVDENGDLKATYDIDWWWRNVFIPRHFGAGGTVPTLFDLDADTAEMLARAVEKGPISAITDVDLANSVALDFLFFLPEQPKAETTQGKIAETALNVITGAAGSTVIDYAKAIEDAMGGYTLRALEKIPKLYGNIAKSMRFSEEGQRTYQGELLGMDKDFWTSDKAILQGLGFSSTEADVRQKQFYDGKKITKEVAAERDKVLSQWRKFIVDVELRGFTPELQAERNRVLEERNKYNAKYPTDPISTDTLFETQMNALEKMRTSTATRGVPLDVTGKTPYLEDIYMRRIKAEEAKAAREQ